MLNKYTAAFIFWFSGLNYYFGFKYFLRTKNKVAV